MPQSSPATAKQIFDHAHEMKSPSERAAYLDAVCGGTPDLRREVETLLRAHDQAGSFMGEGDTVPGATGAYHPNQEAPEYPHGTTKGEAEDGPGSEIGPYRLLQVLGEGGMGVVYRAQQDKPISRQVALKIIRPNKDSGEIVARFNAERQVLTLMDHPNIAKVLDAGANSRNRPYYVMELVQGIPLNAYCSQHALSIRDRLHLFIPICHALQHAHQKGIIHRDVKPSNVLVSERDGKPEPKVIDFGLAKAMQQPLAADAEKTQAGTFLGTFAYVSPEQAALGAEDVDTRTDVYALGAMLYELLTGVTPLEFGVVKTKGVLEALRRIREEDAPRPSDRLGLLGTNLTKIAAERQTEPQRLARQLRGELDWIVMKALEKDRDRRYDTASALGKDLERHLNDEPVEASPPSTSYRLKKFASKNRKLLATAGAFVTLLIVGIVATTWFGLWAFAAERAAVRAKKSMDSSYVLADNTIELMVRRQIELKESERDFLRQVLERTIADLQEPGNSIEERATAAGGHFMVGNIARLLEDLGLAERHYRMAIKIAESMVEHDDASMFNANLGKYRFNLAFLMQHQGELDDAATHYTQAIMALDGIASATPDCRRDLADAHNNLGTCLRDLKQLPKSETALKHAIALGEALLAERDGQLEYQANLGATYHNLGNVIRDQKKPEAALTAYGRAVELLLPVQDRITSAKGFLHNAYWDRAVALGQLQRHTEAVQDWERAIELHEGQSRNALELFRDTAKAEAAFKLQSQPTGPSLQQMATLFARAAAAAAAPDVNETRLSDQYAGRAMELLRHARDTGFYRDPKHVEGLASLQELKTLPRDEFESFLTMLRQGATAPESK